MDEHREPLAVLVERRDRAPRPGFGQLERAAGLVDERAVDAVADRQRRISERARQLVAQRQRRVRLAEIHHQAGQRARPHHLPRNRSTVSPSATAISDSSYASSTTQLHRRPRAGGSRSPRARHTAPARLRSRRCAGGGAGAARPTSHRMPRRRREDTARLSPPVFPSHQTKPSTYAAATAIRCSGRDTRRLGAEQCVHERAAVQVRRDRPQRPPVNHAAPAAASNTPSRLAGRRDQASIPQPSNAQPASRSPADHFGEAASAASPNTSPAITSPARSARTASLALSCGERGEPRAGQLRLGDERPARRSHRGAGGRTTPRVSR